MHHLKVLLCQKILSQKMLSSFFRHFDLDASKIGAKVNNLVIYGDILVNFLKNLSTKSNISQKLKIGKIVKFIFHSFHNIAQLFGPK